MPADARCRAELLLEEPGVVCGVPVATAVFRALDPSVTVEAPLEEGTAVSDVPAVVAVVEGPARAVLTGERVALNLVGRLCGIASLTRRFVELTEGTRTPSSTRARRRPACARSRSTPCAAAAAANHRAGLYDGVLVKENHLRVAGGITAALAALDGRIDGLPVEVEAETIAQVREAIAAGAPRILLDNMSPEEVREAVERGRRPRRARGVRRHVARHRPRLRRDRRRLHLRRRPHPLRPLAPRLPGGHMTVAAPPTTELHEEVRALARARRTR